MYRANLHLNFLCEYGKRKFNSQFNYPKVAAGSVEVIFYCLTRKPVHGETLLCPKSLILCTTEVLIASKTCPE